MSELFWTLNDTRDMILWCLRTVQPARNLHKPSDPGGQNYLRAVEHRGRTPVDPGGHDPRVSRWPNARIRGGRPRGIIAVNGFFIVYILYM